MKNKGTLYIISAPSGTGKSSIIRELRKARPELAFSVSATTRAPRGGDIEGETYFFKTKEEFASMIENGELLEHAEFSGNFYGTPIAPILRNIENGVDTILDIEVKGQKQIKEKMPDCVSIFIIPPSMEILEKRLRQRGTDSEEAILRRLETAKTELLEKDSYDYIVENDILEKAVNDILTVMDSVKNENV